MKTDDELAYDCFISHASEDKTEVAAPLAAALKARGYSVWLDQTELRLGDSLRRSIDAGLRQSRFGVAVLSPAFFAKEWPQRELDAFLAGETDGTKKLIPLWFGLTEKDVHYHSPILADRLAVSWARGIAHVVEQVALALGEPIAKMPVVEVGLEPTESAARHTELARRARRGQTEDIDFLMSSLGDEKSSAVVYIVDHALGLVDSRRGRDRIAHYLHKGTPRQRQLAALYFKHVDDLATLRRALEPE